MEAFLVSVAVVAVGEIGDKTQLLALLLAARFRRPIPIIAGILVATLFNHALAGLVGGWIRSAIDPSMLRWILGISFLAIAAWALVPDKLEEKESAPVGKYGVFAVTLVAFFLAEIGVAGTTAGMLIADVPAVLLGGKASAKLPLRAIRYVAAALFAALGLAVLAGVSFG